MSAVEVDLEHRVVLDHPVIRLGDERLQHGRRDLSVIERPERLPDVVEQGADHVLLVAPVAQRARGGLQAVLETVHRVRLIGLEVGEQTHQQIGQLPNIVVVHLRQHSEVSVAALIHSREVHLSYLVHHCPPSSGAALYSAKRARRRYQTSLSRNPGNAALRPLGFGTTKTRVSPKRSGFGPAPPVARGPTKRRYTVMPTKATTLGLRRAIFRASARRPSAYSAGASSAAERVARGTMFVRASPSSGKRTSSA